MKDNLHPISAEQLRKAQTIDPRNINDAYYIEGHPSEFDGRTQDIACDTVDRHEVRREAELLF